MNDKHDETEPKHVWCCSECGDAHRLLEDAYECCMDPPSEHWACGRCGDTHEEREDARLCCFDEDGRPKPPSPRELEAAGQQRLPLSA